MENLDIKNFKTVSTLDDGDSVLLSRATDPSHGKIKTPLLLSLVARRITPRIDTGGNWYVGDTDTGIAARGADGKTPVFEQGQTDTGLPGTAATGTLTYLGTNADGQPRYRLDFTVPRGEPGQDGLGAGNVYVKADALKADKTYLFRPSADGSANGQMVEYSPQTIGEATQQKDGLLSYLDKRKIDSLKEYEQLPDVLFTLTADSTDDEVRAALIESAGPGVSGMEGMEWYMLIALGGPFTGTYSVDYPKYYHGNQEVFGFFDDPDGLLDSLSGTTFTQSGTFSLHLVMLGPGPVWQSHTIACRVTATQSGTEWSNTFAYSAQVTALGGSGGDSGAGEYVLPGEVFSLTEDSDRDSILAALGGNDGINALVDAVNAGKLITIHVFGVMLHVDVYHITALSVIIAFFNPLLNCQFSVRAGSLPTSLFQVKRFYPEPFALPSGLYTLNGNITSQQFCDAVTGLDGASYATAKNRFKEIGRAIRSDRRLSISLSEGQNGMKASIMGAAMSNNSGEITMISLHGTGYGLFGGISWGSLTIMDNGSSFSVTNDYQ